MLRPAIQAGASSDRPAAMSRPLGALPWWGSKHPARNDQMGQWIAAMLPADCYSYVEPFAGMLGVLLLRPPVRLEVVNDIDERLVIWWKQVRDQPEALAAAIEDTPVARSEFDYCLAAQFDTSLDPLERARAFTVAMWQTYPASVTWRGDRNYAGTGAQTTRSSTEAAKIRALAARIRHVHIEQGCALELVARHAQQPQTVIYCDPPYRPQADRQLWSTRQYPYAGELPETFWDDLERLLLQATCQVAVSGSPGDYPLLAEAGWHMETMPRPLNTQPGGVLTEPSAEAVYLNYPLHEAQPQLWSSGP